MTYSGLEDTNLNPASFANDALYGKVCGSTEREKYDAQDEKLNALVMLPGLRAVGDKVEFSTMWLYPRRGRKWSPGKAEEVTVGYYWPMSVSIAARKGKQIAPEEKKAKRQKKKVGEEEENEDEQDGQ